jgi:hypothetical protein
MTVIACNKQQQQKQKHNRPSNEEDKTKMMSHDRTAKNNAPPHIGDDDDDVSSNSSSSDEAANHHHDDTATPTSSMPNISLFQAEKDTAFIKNKNSPNNNNKKSRTVGGKVAGTLLRCIFLDVPLLTLFTLLTISLLVQKAQDDYLLPQLKLVKWNDDRAEQEITYFRRKCRISDISTQNATDLFIEYPSQHNGGGGGSGGSGGDTIESAVEKMNIHGASIYPNLLSPDTAQQVRDFILAENLKNQDLIYVIENKQRWSFGIQVDDHPSIAQALSEILSNTFLVQTLEALMGENPAVIEFTGITSAYGAAEQAMHQDVIPDGSGAQFARNFVPSYSLFIPLQNTTHDM